MKRLFAALLSLLLLAAPPAVKADGEYDPIGQQFTGVHAPYVTEEGTPSDTEFFTDADFALNSITVVNFWDTGCMNCRIEMPDFLLSSFHPYRCTNLSQLVSCAQTGHWLDSAFRP